MVCPRSRVGSLTVRIGAATGRLSVTRVAVLRVTVIVEPGASEPAVVSPGPRARPCSCISSAGDAAVVLT